MSKETLSKEILISEFLKSVGVENVSRKLIGQIAEVNNQIEKQGVTTDLDSTYFASELIAVRNFNSRHGTNHTIEEMKDRYDMTRWAEQLGVEDPLNHAISFWNDPEELIKLPLSDGTPEVFEFLKQSRIDVPKVTARPGHVAVATRRYFELHEPGSKVYVQEDDVINPAYKINIIVNVLGSRLHLDDAPEEAEKLAEYGVMTGLFPQPWNEDYEPISNLVVTQRQAIEDGIQVLDINMDNFRNLLKMARVYLAMGDRLLLDPA